MSYCQICRGKCGHYAEVLYDDAIAAAKAEGAREERKRCVAEAQAYRLLATTRDSEAWRILGALLDRLRGDHLKPEAGE